MNPFIHSEHTIAENMKLTIIDIESLSGNVLTALDNNFVKICEGDSGSSLSTVKKMVATLYATKNNKWIMGATAEFFVHLYVTLSGFKQEFLALNLEEGSIKKGFDGYYSLNGDEWVMESKSGSINTNNITHSNKIQLAHSDLENKISGNSANNPWRNAYSHASHYDVGSSPQIRKVIKTLSDDFVNGKFHSIEEFNIMPCSTIFLAGVWNPPAHEHILNEIKTISAKLKGKQIHSICVTHKSVNLFLDYINPED
jgi:hypothetical protein